MNRAWLAFTAHYTTKHVGYRQHESYFRFFRKRNFLRSRRCRVDTCYNGMKFHTRFVDKYLVEPPTQIPHAYLQCHVRPKGASVTLPHFLSYTWPLRAFQKIPWRRMHHVSRKFHHTNVYGVMTCMFPCHSTPDAVRIASNGMTHSYQA